MAKKEALVKQGGAELAVLCDGEKVSQADMISLIVSKREVFLKTLRDEARKVVEAAEKAYNEKQKEFRKAFRVENEAKAEAAMGKIWTGLKKAGLKNLQLLTDHSFREGESEISIFCSLSDAIPAEGKKKGRSRHSRHGHHSGFGKMAFMNPHMMCGCDDDDMRYHMKEMLRECGELTLISRDFTFKKTKSKVKAEKEALADLSAAWRLTQDRLKRIRDELNGIDTMEREVKSALLEKNLSETKAGLVALETAEEIATRPVE